MDQPIQPDGGASGERHAARSPGLDGLRGLAVLLVFVFHYGGGLQSPHWLVRVFGHITAAGWTGVVLFFALSGFLITGSLWDSLGSRHLLLNFYARRGLRILPLYFLALALSVLIALARGFSFADLHPFVIYALFLQDIPRYAALVATIALPLPLYHLWSLAVEEQFYLLWPALLLFCHTRRTALWMSLTVFVFSLLFRLVVWGVPLPMAMGGHSWDSFLLTHAGALALGASLALAARQNKREEFSRLAFATLLGGLLLYFFASGFSGTFLLATSMQFTLGLTGVSVAAVALVQLALRPSFAGGLLTLSPLRWMGRISYGFYVFHILLQPVFDKIAMRMMPVGASYSVFLAARFFAAFFLTLFVAWLSYIMLEEPILALKRRFPMNCPLP